VELTFLNEFMRFENYTPRDEFDYEEADEA